MSKSKIMQAYIHRTPMSAHATRGSRVVCPAIQLSFRTTHWAMGRSVVAIASLKNVPGRRVRVPLTLRQAPVLQAVTDGGAVTVGC
jgi:hypothetical protein